MFTKTPIPPPTIQLIERDGRMAQAWYDYFLDIDRAARNVANANLPLNTYTVDTLPAASGNTGLLAIVTDATATTQNSIVAGIGANRVTVFSDGTNWRIA